MRISSELIILQIFQTTFTGTDCFKGPKERGGEGLEGGHYRRRDLGHHESHVQYAFTLCHIPGRKPYGSCPVGEGPGSTALRFTQGHANCYESWQIKPDFYGKCNHENLSRMVSNQFIFTNDFSFGFHFSLVEWKQF